MFSLLGLVAALFICGGFTGGLSSIVDFKERSLRGHLFRLVRKVYWFLANKWNFDLLYNYYFSIPFLGFCYNSCFVFLDQNFLKNFGPIGISRVIYNLSKTLLSPQRGLVYNYAFCICYFLLFFFFVTWCS